MLGAVRSRGCLKGKWVLWSARLIPGGGLLVRRTRASGSAGRGGYSSDSVLGLFGTRVFGREMGAGSARLIPGGCGLLLRRTRAWALLGGEGTRRARCSELFGHAGCLEGKWVLWSARLIPWRVRTAASMLSKQ